MAASKLTMAVIFIFHAIAFGFAVAAERRRSVGRVTADKYDDQEYCVYDSDIASWYGTGAFIFVLMSEALLMAATRCLCCGRALRPGGARTCAIILFILTWLCFLIAEACFVGGSVKNAYHTKYRVQFRLENYSCATLRKGVFAAGAAFTLLNLIFSLLFISNFSKAHSLDGFKPYTDEPAVAMGNL